MKFKQDLKALYLSNENLTILIEILFIEIPQWSEKLFPSKHLLVLRRLGKREIVTVLKTTFSNYNKMNNNNNLDDVYNVDGLGTEFATISSLNWLIYTLRMCILLTHRYYGTNSNT